MRTGYKAKLIRLELVTYLIIKKIARKSQKSVNEVINEACLSYAVNNKGSIAISQEIEQAKQNFDLDQTVDIEDILT